MPGSNPQITRRPGQFLFLDAKKKIVLTLVVGELLRRSLEGRGKTFYNLEIGILGFGSYSLHRMVVGKSVLVSCFHNNIFLLLAGGYDGYRIRNIVPKMEVSGFDWIGD